MFKRYDDTLYVCLSPCFRLVFRNGTFIGWYNPRLDQVLD